MINLNVAFATGWKGKYILTKILKAVTVNWARAPLKTVPASFTHITHTNPLKLILQTSHPQWSLKTVTVSFTHATPSKILLLASDT